MFKIKYAMCYPADGAEGAESGSSGGDDGEGTQSDPEIVKLKGKNSELLGTVRALKDSLKKFDGLDPEKIRTMMSRFENDEESKLIQDGKFDELVNRRIEKQRLALEANATDAQKREQAAASRADKYEKQVLRGQLTEVALDKDIGMHGSAVKYAFLIAMQDGWKLDDDGIARQYDEDGEIVLGKDGKTAYTLRDWLNDKTTREDNPTWYVAGNSGTGAGGNSRTKSGDKTVKRTEFNSWNQQQRKDFFASGGRVVGD